MLPMKRIVARKASSDPFHSIVHPSGDCRETVWFAMQRKIFVALPFCNIIFSRTIVKHSVGVKIRSEVSGVRIALPALPEHSKNYMGGNFPFIYSKSYIARKIAIPLKWSYIGSKKENVSEDSYLKLVSLHALKSLNLYWYITVWGYSLDLTCLFCCQ